jgi:hypothetical protein
MMKKFLVLFFSCFLLINSQAQNVGIGTTAPLARLHVTDSSVLFSAASHLPVVPSPPPVSGAGKRMMWYPDKAAFRVGTVDADQWDVNNIGLFSHAIGNNSKAAWVNTIAIGNNNAATNFSSMAIGNDNTSGGSSSIVIGNGSATATDFSITLGNNVFSGSAYETVLGRWNVPSASFSNNWNPTDRLFVIGNGVSESNRSDALVILKNGNTGIGVGNPSKKLSVGGAANIDDNNANTGSVENSLTFGSSSGEGIGSKRSNGGNQFGLDFYTASSNRLTITNTGNIGINDINPTNRLSVTGNASVSGNVAVGSKIANNSYGLSGNVQSLEIQNQNAAIGSTAQLFLINNNLTGGVGGISFGSAAIGSGSKLLGQITGLFETSEDAFNPTGRLYFSTRGVGGNSIRMLIAGNGNVGIGVGEPMFKLDLGGRMRIRSAPGLSAGVWMNNDDNSASPAFVGMRQNDEVGFYGQTGVPDWRFVVNTTNENAWLQGSLAQNSDARLKTNILPLKNAMEHLAHLHGYTYNWKDPAADSTLQIGMIAQEVLQAFPQLVKQNDKGVLSVNYMGLIPVLLEAVKEQQREITDLKLLVKQLLTSGNFK